MKLTRDLCWVISILVLVAGCGPKSAAPADTAPAPTTATAADDYREAAARWRAEREAGLKKEDGWLSLVGLHWLTPGENVAGTGADADFRLPDGSAPAVLATFDLKKDGTVILSRADGSVTVNEAPAGLAPRSLATDKSGKADMIRAGRLLMYLIDRNGEIALRVKDPEAPTRTGFAGLQWYDVDPAWRITARFEAYDAPKEITVPTVLGTESPSPSPGRLHFNVDGVDVILDPLADSATEPLFVIFRDATNDHGTYSAGRFLSVDPPTDGVAIIDFNYAYNPPCAYSPYATCPLAPSENRLKIAIPAGERYSGETH